VTLGIIRQHGGKPVRGSNIADPHCDQAGAIGYGKARRIGVADLGRFVDAGLRDLHRLVRETKQPK
jgi:hypothetical protein